MYHPFCLHEIKVLLEIEISSNNLNQKSKMRAIRNEERILNIHCMYFR